MKRIIVLIFTSFCMIFLGCVCDRIPFNFTCDIKVEKIFFLPFSRSTLFKVHLTEAHPYSAFTEENVNDSLYYIYCPAKKPGDEVVFECKIKNIGKDSVLIQTYKVVWFSIFDDDNQKFYKTLSSEEYLKIFENNFISKLKDKDTMNYTYFFDNKNDYEVWQTLGQRSFDSLDKAYKRKKITPPL